MKYINFFWKTTTNKADNILPFSNENIQFFKKNINIITEKPKKMNNQCIVPVSQQIYPVFS